MAENAKQLEVMREVEMLFQSGSIRTFADIERGLLELGFVQKGGDPAIAAFENTGAELFIDVELDEDGRIHGYELFPFDELHKRQEKFRW